MNKNTYLRLGCMLLALLMLLCVFIACAKPGDESQDTTTKASDNTPDNPSDTTAADTSDVYESDDIPADLNYNGKTITLLYWGDREHEEFEVAKQMGENVNDAIFNRNLTIEDRLGIDMAFISTDGDSDNVNNWVKYVNNSISAGGGEFDVFACYSLSMAATASKGMCYNLLDSECEYLNFDKPWWPERLITEATINDKLYFASGDISANALYMMYCCFVNTDIIEEMNLPNVFDLVKNNEWTYDKFISMCSNVYIDQNADGVKSVGDRFGYMTSGIHVDPWFYGSGALIVDKDAEGNLRMAPSFSGEKVISTIEMLNTLLHKTDDGMYTPNVQHQLEFNNGNLLFAIDRCRISITKFDNPDLHYSVVPCPKYDSAQESFVTVMGNPFTLYGIPIDAKDDELSMLSAYLETYASESYRQVTPELYEVSLKTKYVQESDSAKMYDIIRESLSFDLGRIFSASLVGQSTFRNVIKDNQTNWASQSKAIAKQMPKLLEKLISAYTND